MVENSQHRFFFFSFGLRTVKKHLCASPESYNGDYLDFVYVACMQNGDVAYIPTGPVEAAKPSATSGVKFY